MGALALLFGVTFTAVFAEDSETTADQEVTVITDYQGNFEVDDEGNLSVTEKITVDFPVSGKHGIFRFFDVADQNYPATRRIPYDISVTRDGQPDELDISTESGRRYVVARIGDPDRTVSTGIHVYEIRYRIDGVVEEGVEGAGVFYWNLIPGGWQQAIKRATLRVELPGNAKVLGCAVGSGASSGCTPRVDGNELVVKVAELDDHTPVTLKTEFGVPASLAPGTGGKRLPWSSRWDDVLGRNPPVALGIGFLAGLAALGGAVTAWRTRESKPSYPLQYSPPEGLGPAQAQYLFTERNDRKSLVASLMYAAERGALDMSSNGGAWALADTGNRQALDSLDVVTQNIVQRLDVPNTTFVANRSSIAAGQQLQGALSGMYGDAKGWATSQRLMAPSGLRGAGGIVAAGCLIAIVAICIIRPFGLAILALIPGAFLLAAVGLAAPESATYRTGRGRDLWSRIGGFRRILTTESAQDRFDFSGRQNIYAEYLPWAVAFGVADQWAEKYRSSTGQEPPVPSYLHTGYYGGLGGSIVDSVLTDFDDTVNSAIGSYEESLRPPPSSSGGGGFSGGGGGGGGGGGSW